MTITWSDYCRWAHESGTRKSGPGVPESERAALMKIWGFGLGGEALEFLTEVLAYEEPPSIATRVRSFFDRVMRHVNHGAADQPGGISLFGVALEIREYVSIWESAGHLSVKAKLEIGDVLFYFGRLYVDSGNARREACIPPKPSLKLVCKHVGAVVECMKKAFRSEGDEGLLRLCVPESEQQVTTDAKGVGIYANCKMLPGRREEFGVLLDQAVGAIEGWLVSRGSTLSEVCELNIDKLVKRRKEGLISAQGERVSELGVAVRPEDLSPRFDVVDGAQAVAERAALESRMIRPSAGPEVSTPRGPEVSTPRGPEVPSPKRSG